MDCEERCNTPEQNVNQAFTVEYADDQLGPIHDFNIWIPPEPSAHEVVPPSYDEAVGDNNAERLQANSVVTGDKQVVS